jgi:hypothetical protein
LSSTYDLSGQQRDLQRNCWIGCEKAKTEVGWKLAYLRAQLAAFMVMNPPYYFQRHISQWLAIHPHLPDRDCSAASHGILQCLLAITPKRWPLSFETKMSTTFKYVNWSLDSCIGRRLVRVVFELQLGSDRCRRRLPDCRFHSLP